MITVISLAVTAVAIVVHLILMKKARTLKNVLEVILLYALFILFGLGTFTAGLMHIFNGPATARLIGWAPGSPFQFEVGAADVAFGALGILCLFIRDAFWPAAIITNTIFLLIAFAGHLNSLMLSGNTAAYNIGPAIIFTDLILPLVVTGLYIIYSREKA